MDRHINDKHSNAPPAPTSRSHTPPLASVSTPSTTLTYTVSTPPHEGTWIMTNDFPLYPAELDWLATYGMQPETIDAMDLALENPSPFSLSYSVFPCFSETNAWDLPAVVDHLRSGSPPKFLEDSGFQAVVEHCSVCFHPLQQEVPNLSTYGLLKKAYPSTNRLRSPDGWDRTLWLIHWTKLVLVHLPFSHFPQK
ncbi:uncharacterized protein TrAtP1_002361 [Trichoderma atroviride]|uniref:uncharacterized protein n=1 Tax=Hypocrea atroviridis TaxID=63577 RepID=UPI0033170289|nr:hypothetical protein TrAtP1_002361 [Trichoderma atroviride]